MAGGQKKVIVRPFSGEPRCGYLPGSGFSALDSVSLLDPAGRVISLSIKETKLIAFIRDFNLTDTADPERIGRRTFSGRPRAEGLWLRLDFRDGDALEGLVASDLSLLDGLVEDGGLFLSPPDARSNTQRVFVPRSALTGIELLGVIRPAAARKPAGVRPDAAANQPGLFGDAED